MINQKVIQSKQKIGIEEIKEREMKQAIILIIMISSTWVSQKITISNPLNARSSKKYMVTI